MRRWSWRRPSASRPATRWKTTVHTASQRPRVRDLHRGEYPRAAVFPDPPPRTVYDRLVDAWEAYLRGVHELTGSLFQPDWKFAQWVPWLLWRSVMQRARVIHLDLKVGYSEEALDHARPMISATMILCLIAGSSNPGGWALRYYVEITRRDHDFIDQQLQLGLFSEDYAERKRKEADEAYEEAVRGANERDGIILPEKLAPAPTTKNKNPKPDERSWSGLNDRGSRSTSAPGSSSGTTRRTATHRTSRTCSQWRCARRCSTSSMAKCRRSGRCSSGRCRHSRSPSMRSTSRRTPSPDTLARAICRPSWTC
jgi:hypothetical protein